MGISVVPAHRVVAKFARQAMHLSPSEAGDAIEQELRPYVRNLLSNLHPSFAELGERSAITHLGDPDPGKLVQALSEMEAGRAKEIAEEALRIAATHLPRPDINARVVILPGDSESTVLVQQMKGVLGFSLGAQVVLTFVWPTENWQRWLGYTMTHEYAHLVRNHLFPRGLAGGRLVYMRTQEPETLLDAMIVEGLADTFALGIVEHADPPWTEALSPDVERRIWPKVLRRLSVSDPSEIRRMLFGDNDRIPTWTGYTIGHHIVRRYMEVNGDASVAGMIGIPASTIFEASGYDPLA
ncbi:MAG: DUF2268 domain-containing putative Zn-dependent protease [Chloroflexi bacterium]|nr:DUF2268 domain-containing putative Zn-dependent protease [Chloroflexota bacterium]